MSLNPSFQDQYTTLLIQRKQKKQVTPVRFQDSRVTHTANKGLWWISQGGGVLLAEGKYHMQSFSHGWRRYAFNLSPSGDFFQIDTNIYFYDS